MPDSDWNCDCRSSLKWQKFQETGTYPGACLEPKIYTGPRFWYKVIWALKHATLTH